MIMHVMSRGLLKNRKCLYKEIEILVFLMERPRKTVKSVIMVLVLQCLLMHLLRRELQNNRKFQCKKTYFIKVQWTVAASFYCLGLLQSAVVWRSCAEAAGVSLALLLHDSWSFGEAL